MLKLPTACFGEHNAREEQERSDGAGSRSYLSTVHAANSALVLSRPTVPSAASSEGAVSISELFGLNEGGNRSCVCRDAAIHFVLVPELNVAGYVCFAHTNMLQHYCRRHSCDGRKYKTMHTCMLAFSHVK